MNIVEKREYQRKWVAKRRAAWFEGKCCVRCGSVDKLELDHIDPKLKVSHNVWSWSVDKRDAEILKCQVLCQACHQQKTISQMPDTHGFDMVPHGHYKMYRRHGCRCGLCKDAHASKVRAEREARRVKLAN